MAAGWADLFALQGVWLGGRPAPVSRFDVQFHAAAPQVDWLHGRTLTYRTVAGVETKVTALFQQVGEDTALITVDKTVSALAEKGTFFMGAQRWKVADVQRAPGLRRRCTCVLEQRFREVT